MRRYCPNCNRELDLTRPTGCPNCSASFGNESAWFPTLRPGGRYRAFPKSPASPLERRASGMKVWILIKLLVSLPMVVLLTYVLLSGKLLQEPLAATAASLFLLLLLVSLWVRWHRVRMSDRAIGVCVVLTSAAFGWMALSVAWGKTVPSGECHGRRVWFCELSNWLYSVGGPYLAAAPWAAVCIGALILGLACLVNSQRRMASRPNPFIERTRRSGLRPPRPDAHVRR